MKTSSHVWDAAAPAVENAKSVLPEMARRFFAEGRKAVKHQGSAAKLHRFRIQAKRFRYTLELFQPLYGPGLKRMLNALRELQSGLGEMNDCAVTRELLRRCDPAAEGESVKLATAFLESQTASGAANFVRRWRENFDAEDTERKWVRYLERYARPASRG